ncbi:hypothetical protein HNQ91_001819 [Filimonas zeae]|uniref:hypothetical protein n=1 Tax=Filimonas zeae TaxID=1737353 RepID=UPI0016691147|nr:hypothetical protein [Filimonas zeae]MDR6338768.1 hypothetical protein [Filimonas zeae]
MAWYSLPHGANPLVPSQYVSVGDTPPTCNGNLQVCAVFADGGTTPVLSQPLKDEIITALNNHSSTANVKLRTP